MSAAARTIELDELDIRGRVVELSTDAASTLVETDLVDVQPVGRGHWHLRSKGRVGSVRVDDVAVRVVPHAKLGLTQLFFLLEHAADDAFLASSVAARDDDELWPSVATALAALCEKALSTGILRGYQRRDEALTTLRGRIRIGDQISRRPGLMIPLEVSYSEYTPDIAENRILRTAAHRLQFLPELSDATRSRLARIARSLDHAEIIGQGSPVPQWTSTRLNNRFGPALRLADRILRSTSIEIDGGTAATAAFVTDMPDLFEAYVRSTLTPILSSTPHGSAVVDPPVFLDANDEGEGDDAVGRHGRTNGRHRNGRNSGTGSSSTGSIIGDIPVPAGLVYRVDKTPVATFSTTYPTIGGNTAAVHFRLLAACTALGIDQAFLIYPAFRHDVVSRPRRIVHTNISIVEYPVDLSEGPVGVKAQLTELAKFVNSRAALPTSTHAADE